MSNEPEQILEIASENRATYLIIGAIESSFAHANTINSTSGFGRTINCRTFTSTVHTTLPTRTASQGVSFAFITFDIKITTSLSASHGIS